MEKYGIAQDDLIESLRNEEHDLMLECMHYMNGAEKTASESARHQQVEARLQIVRARIADHDLKKSDENG